MKYFIKYDKIYYMKIINCINNINNININK